MKKKIFTGVATAIITPFKGEDQSSVDFDKLGTLVEFQINNKADAIVVCGTTGEASTMPDEEHLSVIEYVVNKTAKRIPVIAGVGSNDTAHALKLTEKAEALGCDALLHVTPYYNKTTQKGLVAHFSRIASVTSLPIILYNVPGRTNLNIDPATLEELCKLDNINGIKECNLTQVPEVVKRCGDALNMYTGEDGQAYFMMSAGGIGLISVLSNIYPAFVHDMIQSYLDGNTKQSWEMQLSCLDLVKALFCEVNPIPVKEACNMLGMDVGSCRLPLVDMTEANKDKLRMAIASFKYR